MGPNGDTVAMPREPTSSEVASVEEREREHHRTHTRGWGALNEMTDQEQRACEMSCGWACSCGCRPISFQRSEVNRGPGMHGHTGRYWG